MIQSQIEKELGFKLKDLHPTTLVNVASIHLNLHTLQILEEHLDREISVEEAFELDIKGVLKLMKRQD